LKQFFSYFSCKVREGRTNGNVVDAETFSGVAEVMLIVQVNFFYFFKNFLGKYAG